MISNNPLIRALEEKHYYDILRIFEQNGDLERLMNVAFLTGVFNEAYGTFINHKRLFREHRTRFAELAKQVVGFENG